MTMRTTHFVRRAPLPEEKKRGRGRPTGAKTGALPRIPPAETRRCFYSEAEVEAWIHARIRDVEWQPSPTDGAIRRQRLITRRDMLLRVGLSYPTIWKLEKVGLFPAPVKITPTGLWTSAAEAAE